MKRRALWLAIFSFAIMGCVSSLQARNLNSILQYFTATSIPNGQGISSLMQSTAAGTNPKTLRVLFIGNSLTFVNNLPWMLVQIASADARNTTQFQVQSATEGGAWLKKTREKTSVQNLLNQRWDIVVLQENSNWAMRADWAAETIATAPAWAADIQTAGARPLLYIAWPRKEGSADYKNADLVFYGKNFETMRALNNYNGALFAAKLNASIVNAGDAWAQALQQSGMPELYQPDGNHPSVAGTYLTALLFYRYFTGAQIDGVNYAPPGLSTSDAAAIRASLH